MRLNLRQSHKKIKKQLPITLAGRIREIYKENFEVAKAILLEDFENHPVTKELEEGRADPLYGRNISGRLDGVGNLYSFIGFKSSEGNPLDVIRDILKDLKVGKAVGSNGKVIIATNIKGSLKEYIYRKTPLPWATGRSWAKGIEEGISGFGYYLRTEKGGDSRSGGGLQSTKQKVRSGRYENGPYLSPMLNDFFKRINKL